MKSIAFFLIFLSLFSCKSKDNTKVSTLGSLDLKRGEVISCGPQEGEIFGTVSSPRLVPAFKKCPDACLHASERNK